MEKQLKNTVTVIIPCYNDGEYIMESINSVLNQTVLPVKIIIVDDGSNAETVAILKVIDNDLVEVLFQPNQGVCRARNNGISKSETSYILTLDADDIFKPTFIEKAKAILDRDSSVGVVCCHYTEFGKGLQNKDIIKTSGHTEVDFLVKNNGVASALFRKECWEAVAGYDEDFKKGYEDWDFWLSVLSKGWLMEVIKEPLFYYRKKMNSRDTTAVGQYDQELRMQLFEKHKEVYLTHFDTFAHQVIWRNSTLQKTLHKSTQRIEYRTGKAILRPFRFIKQFFNSTNG